MADYDVIYNANEVKPAEAPAQSDFDVIYNHAPSQIEQPTPSLGDTMLHAGGIIASDISKGVGNFWHGIGNLGESIPAWVHKAEAGGKYLYENPLKALKELGIGGVRATGQFADIPHKSLQYLAHLGLISPQASQHLMAEQAVENKIPGVRKQWGLESTPENEGAQFLTQLPGEAAMTRAGIAALPLAGKAITSVAKAGIGAAKRIPQMIPGIAKTAKAAQADLTPLAQKVNELKQGTNIGGTDLESQMNQHLNQNAEHRLAAGIGVNYKINQLKKSLGDNYNLIERNLAEKNVPLHEPLSGEQQRKLFNSLTEGKDLSKLSKEDIDKLTHMGEGKQISALDLYQGIRDLGKKIRDDRKIAYGHDVLQEVRDKAKERIKDYQDQIKELEPKLKQVMSPEDKLLWEKTNKAYRENIVPLQKSPIYRELKNNKTLPKNMMAKLVGLSPDKQIIKNIIKSDPKILRNVVGEKYAGKLEKLHDRGATENEYISHMPEFQQMIEKHKKLTEAKKSLESAKEYKENAKMSLKDKMKTLRNIGLGASFLYGAPKAAEGIENLFSHKEEHE